MGNLVKTIVLQPGTMSDDADTVLAMKVPTGYGGVTIIDASVESDSAGTLALYLVNYGTGGTVVGGTIAANASGTAKVWVAGAPVSLAITAAQAFVDEGEYVFLKKVESAAANDLGDQSSVVINYVDGVITQG